MKRRLTKLVVFLLLGAIVNVAVAWGVVQFKSYLQISVVVAQVVPDLRARITFGSDELEHSDFVLTGSAVTVRSVVLEHTEHHQMPRGTRRVTLEVGWPMRALFAPTYRLRGGWTDDGWTLALIPRTDDFGGTYQPELPLRPLWPGFTINTIFYAAILWLLAFGTFTTHRIIRRKRGHCIKCGYDLRDDFSAGCPECGWRRGSGA